MSVDSELLEILVCPETKQGLRPATSEELAALKLSYEHLVKLRDEVIDMGVLPPLEEWVEVNPNLALAEAVPA